MIRQLAVMPVLDITFQFTKERRICRDARQKLLEAQDMLCRIDSQLHLMMHQPDEFEMSVFKLTVSAKHTPVGICLQTLSDYAQMLIGHQWLYDMHPGSIVPRKPGSNCCLIQNSFFP